ncbi:MAG: hypothetical protein LUE92_13795 [Clostridiales bacterium]|nr:hypothetical protein [Clostridiales bacterium]
MAKNLSYFMREEAKQEQIVTVPGPDTIKDENGNVVNLEIKKLSNDTISKINEMYETKTLLRDKKGNFVVQNGVAVYKVDRDRNRAARHLMVEALVYPDLRDKKLMDFFGCVDITEMPLKVFPDNKEYLYVSQQVLKVLNLTDEDDDEQELEDAKNS